MNNHQNGMHCDLAAHAVFFYRAAGLNQSHGFIFDFFFLEAR